MEEQSLFIAAPFFMVRAPILPAQEFFSLIKKGASLSIFPEEK